MSSAVHRDSRALISSRVASLLGEMTLLEKCHQLTSVPPWALIAPDGAESARLTDTLARPPGHIAGLSLDRPEDLHDAISRAQRLLVERSRLGIPAIVHAEGVNGLLSGGYPVFPTPTGLAATWSPDLVGQMADLIRRHMVSAGVRHVLGPVLDVALDPRWGRVHETYGEDPYLAAALGVAYVRNIQGDDLRDGVIATGKHFLGYAASESGLNMSAVEIGPRRLRELFAFPFEATIHEAKLGSVMNSYSDIDGVPAGASPAILRDLLRDTLGFEGFVSSDYRTLEHLVTRQKVAATPGDAARLALAAGLDVEFPSAYGYGDALEAEVVAGRVDVGLVDESVTRVLSAKFDLGLFEHPYPRERISLATAVGQGEQLSRELARRGVILLANSGILPVDRKVRRVAVIGPHAVDVASQFPTYTYLAWREMTLRRASGGLANQVGIDPDLADWSGRELPEVPTEDLAREWYGARSLGEAVATYADQVIVEAGSGLTEDASAESFGRAIRAAEGADLVILALGGASLWFDGQGTEGEGSDSADIGLPPAQVRLANAVSATGTPMVSVVFQGRAYAIPDSVQNSAAIIVSSFGGPFGPDAVAEVLFGVTEPSGKLPYSIPRHSGQIPVYHHQRAGTGYRHGDSFAFSPHYLDMPARPHYAFGHGLSYTDFVLSDPGLPGAMTTEGCVEIAAMVTNVGTRPGATVVQLYLGVTAHGVTRPAQQLAGFARVELSAGASAKVGFVVDSAHLGFFDGAGVFGVHPCQVSWCLGFDSDDRALSGAIEVTGTSRPLRSSDRVFVNTPFVTESS